MKMFVVAGDPISHSLSPAMHNAAFHSLGLDDCIYQPMRIDNGSIASLISLMREGKISGANLTHPLKECVIPLLDKLSSEAGACGSVNTICARGSMLIGDTTDGEGCVKALHSKGVKILGKKVLIIGAGGAAKSIGHSIAKRGPRKIYVSNRTGPKAQKLAEDLGEYGNVAVRPWEALGDAAYSADIIINCTNVGMDGFDKSLPVDAEDIGGDKVVMDIVYQPLRTELLRKADDLGCVTVNGLEMLVWQGALSFERWTGLKPPVNVMRKNAEAQIGGKLGCKVL